MSQITVNELVTVTYKNDVITIKGKSFTVSGKLSSAELMKIYWGSEGKGSARVTVDVPDAKPEVVAEKKKESPQYATLDAFIEAKAAEGLSEDQIMSEIMKRLND